MALKIPRRVDPPKPQQPTETLPAVLPPPPEEPAQPDPSVEAAREVHLPVLTGSGTRIDLPPRECSTCYINQLCPEFREAYVCAFDEKFRAMGVSTVDEALKSMQSVIHQNLERLQFAYLAERTVSSGQIDPNVTRLSESVLRQIQEYTAFKKSSQQITIAGSVGAVQKLSGGGGALSRLFGAGQVQGEDPNLNPQAEQVTVSFTKTE